MVRADGGVSLRRAARLALLCRSNLEELTAFESDDCGESRCRWWQVELDAALRRCEGHRRPCGQQGGTFARQFVERGLDKANIKIIGPGDLTDDDELPGQGDVWHRSAIHARKDSHRGRRCPGAFPGDRGQTGTTPTGHALASPSGRTSPTASSSSHAVSLPMATTSSTAPWPPSASSPTSRRRMACRRARHSSIN